MIAQAMAILLPNTLFMPSGCVRFDKPGIEEIDEESQ